jgi:hypothetical protein
VGVFLSASKKVQQTQPAINEHMKLAHLKGVVAKSSVICHFCLLCESISKSITTVVWRRMLDKNPRIMTIMVSLLGIKENHFHLA